MITHRTRKKGYLFVIFMRRRIAFLRVLEEDKLTQVSPAKENI